MFAPRAPKEPPHKATEDIAVFTLPIPPYPCHPFEGTLGTTSKENEGTCLILEQPHARLAESEVARQVISEITMSATRHSPNDIAAFLLLVPQSNPGLPPALVSLASPNNGERRAAQVVDKENEMSMKSSPEVKHKGVFSVKMPQELPDEAANIECSDEHPPYHEAPALPVPVDPGPPDAANTKRPSQETVSNLETSVLLRSPESPAALMLPTLADPLPVYALPRSSLGLESWLRWRPPDCKKESKRHACYAVNNRLQPSAMEHLPPPGTAFRLSILRSSLAYIVQANSPRLLNVEVIW